MGKVRETKRPKTLVLLSSTFPAAGGDTAFLQNEIEALAESFDRILIYSHFPIAKGKETYPLPSNARYVGAVRSASRWEGVAAVATPSGLKRALSALRAEARGKRTKGRWKDTLASIFTGGRFARVIERGIPASLDVTVYSFWGTDSAVALPFLRSSYRKAVRFHRHDLYEYRTPGLPLRAAILGAADHILPISEDGADYLQKMYGNFLETDNVALARLGTADHGLGPTPNPSDPWTIVSCSYVVPVKRVDEILAALQQASLRHPIRWVHFGDGPGYDDLYRSAKAGEEDFSDLKVEIRGYTPNQEVMEFYKRNPVHAFINISSSEGVPVSIMEALSFGIPVVATDVGGTAELVNEELGTGVLLPADPAAAQVSEAVQEVAARSDFRAREAWQEHADAAVNVKRLMRILGPRSATSGTAEHF